MLHCVQCMHGIAPARLLSRLPRVRNGWQLLRSSQTAANVKLLQIKPAYPFLILVTSHIKLQQLHPQSLLSHSPASLKAAASELGSISIPLCTMLQKSPRAHIVPPVLFTSLLSVMHTDRQSLVLRRRNQSRVCRQLMQKHMSNRQKQQQQQQALSP